MPSSRSDNLVLLDQAIDKHVPEAQRGEMRSFLRSIMHAESGGSLTAKNSHSSATGLFQFTTDTWNQYAPGQNIYDPAAQCDAVVRFALDNEKVLHSVLGREPTAGEYYLAHFAGAGGAKAVLSADPSTPISGLLGAKAMSANAGIQFYGKSFAQFTAGDLRSWASARMGVQMDDREDFSRRMASSTNKPSQEEVDQEVIKRQQILESFGVSHELSKTIADFSNSPLGQLFFQVIIGLLNQSAPAGERINVPLSQLDTDKMQLEYNPTATAPTQAPIVPNMPRAQAVPALPSH